MSTQFSRFGMHNAFDWTIAGALGGVLGAAAFGALMWLFDPAVVVAAIPALYGIEQAGILGWTIHLAHGAVLGVVFGFLISRRAVLGFLRTDVDTDAISDSGIVMRVVGAGFAYGLAVWALLPAIVLPVWVDAVGTDAAGDFPAVAVESLAGHLLFGLVLGLVYAATVDLTDWQIETPLEE